MNNLLNVHGKFYGTFWACKTCTDIGWSPKFNSKNEMEMHINKIHIGAKRNKNNMDDKMSMIINTIKEHDEQFLSLIDQDSSECFERIQFCIGYEENLNNLDDSAFENLIKQIETFYLEKEDYDSLVNYNYVIEYNVDIITGNKVAFITEAETAKDYVLSNVKVEPPNHESKSRNVINNDLNKHLTCDDEQLKTHEVKNIVIKLEKDNVGDHDSTSEQIIACEYCLYKTKENKYMQWHMETFHEENLFICEKCDFSSFLKRSIIIHMEIEHCEQGKNIESDDQISSNTHYKREDIIDKTHAHPYEFKNGNDMIKKDSICVANIEYDDVLIDEIENLTITNYDWYTTESSCVSIKEELLNYNKDNKKLVKRQCGKYIGKEIKSDLNGKYWTGIPSQEFNPEEGNLRRSSRLGNRHMKMDVNFIKNEND